MRFRIIAIVAALLCTALLIGLASWMSTIILPWMDGLSPDQRSLLRTWIPLSGALIPVLALVLRRPGEAEDDREA
jgi:hypothetical protein